MNAPEKLAFLPDIQSQADNRHLRIDAVGVNRVRYPITIRSDERLQPTIAMHVTVPATSLCPCSKEISAIARIVRATPVAGSTQSGKQQDRHLHLLSNERRPSWHAS